MNTQNLTKKEKIELIKKIQSGEINVLNGQIIDKGVVLIRDGDKYYLNNTEVDSEKIQTMVEVMIILPAKKPIEG